MQKRKKSLLDFLKDFGSILSVVTTLAITFNAFFQLIKGGLDGNLLTLLVSGGIVVLFLVSFYFSFVWVPVSETERRAQTDLILPKTVSLRNTKQKSKSRRIKNTAYVTLVSIPILICLDLLGWLVFQDSYLWQPLYIAQINSQKLPEFSNTCTNARHGIEVKHPASWQCQQVKNPFTQTVLSLSPQVRAVDVNMEVKLLIQRYPTLTLQSLDELLDDHLTVLKIKKFNNLNILGSSKTIFLEQSAYRLEYTAKDKDLPVRYEELLTLKEGIAYIVTYAAEASIFPKHRRIAREITKTLRLIEP